MFSFTGIPMLLRRQTIFTLFIITLLALSMPPCAFASGAAGSSCVNWANIFAENELASMHGGTIVAIQPFTDGTKFGDDGWLSLGIRDYLKDILRSSGKLKVLAGNTLTYGGGLGVADLNVGGMFQRVSNLPAGTSAAGKLRVFITVTDGRTGELKKQMEVVFPYPDNREFFLKLADAAKDIMKLAHAKPNSDTLSRIQNATSSTRAFQSYSKGRQDLETHAIDKAEVASTWFVEAKRIDYRSALGYQGLVDLYTFLGLYHKQLGEAFAVYFQKAESEMLEMERLARPAPAIFSDLNVELPKKKKKIENRFMLGNMAYSEGLTAMQAGMVLAAEGAFKRAIELVPEDSFSWYYLSKVLSLQGSNKAAEEAMAKAREMNACLGDQR